jgi:hypothetical protein
MTRFAYTVTATFPDAAIADEFVGWLRDGHVRAVIAGGAREATIVRLDVDPAPAREPATATRPAIEIKYEFDSREDFERYLRLHAPALRAEGMAKFGPERGVVLSRTLGTVIDRLHAPNGLTPG